MDAELTRQLIELVERAGDAILEIYRTDFSVDIKTDNSPLTQADLAAHRIIAAELAQLTPEIPLLSEESRPPSYTQRKSWSRYWLVDPLDGTKEFVNKNGEFTVNIALIDDHRSVFGVVGVPVQGLVYTGDLERGEAYCYHNGARERLHGRVMGDDQPLVVVASRSHGRGVLEALVAHVQRVVGALYRGRIGLLAARFVGAAIRGRLDIVAHEPSGISDT